MKRALAALAVAAVAVPAFASAAPAQPSGTDSSTATVFINRFDKAAVNAAYKSRYSRYGLTGASWTGKVSPCIAGAPSTTYRAGVTSSMNFARNLARLDPVVQNATLNSRAQAAALIMEANNTITHSPPSSYRCWTATGKAAAGESNLAMSSGPLTASAVSDLYLDDPGAGNLAVGHRRWLLYPYLSSVGVGGTTRMNALRVIGSRDNRRANPAWVTWPTSGYFPKTLEPAGRWSIGSGSDTASFRSAKVTVTRGTTTYPVTVLNRGGVNYGKPGVIVFRVGSTALPAGTYTVKVTGVTGAAATSYTYKTTLFTPY